MGIHIGDLMVIHTSDVDVTLGVGDDTDVISKDEAVGTTIDKGPVITRSMVGHSVQQCVSVRAGAGWCRAGGGAEVVDVDGP